MLDSFGGVGLCPFPIEVALSVVNTWLYFLGREDVYFEVTLKVVHFWGVGLCFSEVLFKQSIVDEFLLFLHLFLVAELYFGFGKCGRLRVLAWTLNLNFLFNFCIFPIRYLFILKCTCETIETISRQRTKSSSRYLLFC